MTSFSEGTCDVDGTCSQDFDKDVTADCSEWTGVASIPQWANKGRAWLNGHPSKSLSSPSTESYMGMDLSPRAKAALPVLKEKLQALLDSESVVMGQHMISVAALCVLSKDEAKSAFLYLEQTGILAFIPGVNSSLHSGNITFALASPAWVKRSLEALEQVHQVQSFQCSVCCGGLLFSESIRQLPIRHLEMFVRLLVSQSICNIVEPVFTVVGEIEGLVDKTDEILLHACPGGLLEEMKVKGFCLAIPGRIADGELTDSHTKIVSLQGVHSDLWEVSCQVVFKVPPHQEALHQITCQLQRQLLASVTVRLWKYGLAMRSNSGIVSMTLAFTGSGVLPDILKANFRSSKRSDPECSELWSWIYQTLDVLAEMLEQSNYPTDNQQIICSDEAILHAKCRPTSGFTCQLLRAQGTENTGQLLLLVSHERSGRCGWEREFVCRVSSSSPGNDPIAAKIAESDGCGILGHTYHGYRQRLMTKDGLDLEEDRLRTFRRWPGFAAVRPEPLAKAGFYYRGVRDEVVCFVCNVVCRQWRPNQDPLEVHRTKSPACPFVANAKQLQSPERVPNRLAVQHAPPVDFSSTACDPGSIISAKHGASYDIRSSSCRTAVSLSESRMAIEANRLATFDGGWPISCPVQPKDLARMGFVYTGEGDSVQCFSCRIALRGWETGDTAEGEHRRHSPHCPFLSKVDNDRLQGAVIPREPFSLYPDRQMVSEGSRLSTFNSVQWPDKVSIKVSDLVEAGLYYVGRGDSVRCFHCHVILASWVNGDLPIEEHLKHSPDCNFARRVAQSKRQRELTQTAVKSTASVEVMSSYTARVNSFWNWPRAAPVRPEELASAGFYYAGYGDSVRCFSCCASLRGWAPGDTAWGEHRRYSPSCQFVLQNALTDVYVPTPGYDKPWTESKGKFERSGESQRSTSCVPPLDVQAVSATRQFATSATKTFDTEGQSGWNSQFLQLAVEMGFSRATAERVIAQHVQEKGSPYTEMDQFIEDLIVTQAEAEISKSPSASGIDRIAPRKGKDTDVKLEKQANPLASLDELRCELNKMPSCLPRTNPSPVDVSRTSPWQSAQTAKAEHANTPEDHPAAATAHTSLLPKSSPQCSASGRSEVGPTSDARLCRICMDRDRAVVFLDCAHVVSCSECAERLFECPICRKPIRAKVRALFD